VNGGNAIVQSILQLATPLATLPGELAAPNWPKSVPWNSNVLTVALNAPFVTVVTPADATVLQNSGDVLSVVRRIPPEMVTVHFVAAPTPVDAPSPLTAMLTMPLTGAGIEAVPTQVPPAAALAAFGAVRAADDATGKASGIASTSDPASARATIPVGRRSFMRPP
jgi:hypothetical protein